MTPVLPLGDLPVSVSGNGQNFVGGGPEMVFTATMSAEVLTADPRLGSPDGGTVVQVTGHG